MDVTKFRLSYLRRVVRARRRWARRRLEQRTGVLVRRWPETGTVVAEQAVLLRRLGVTCVIDVGAHEGEFARSLRRLGYSERIVSFEPASKAFRRLQKRASRDLAWSIHNIALGPASGAPMLMTFDQTQFNSLLSPKASNDWSGRTEFVLRVKGSERVRMKRLDDVWSEIVHEGDVVFLKVDTQGFDLQVLEGAEVSLNRCAAIQVEVSGLPLYEATPPLHEVVAHLYNRSFRVTGLFPVMRYGGDGVQVVDFDATFVHVPT